METKYLALEGSIRAEVRSIFPAREDKRTREVKDAYVLSVSEMLSTTEDLEGEITFSLTSETWPYKRQPKIGQVVYLSDCILLKKPAGFKWRANSARPWRPIDELTWRKSPGEFIENAKARVRHLLQEAKIRLKRMFRPLVTRLAS